jgi:hypothetical protein
VPILTIFRADPTRGVYALHCPRATYLAQVLVWRKASYLDHYLKYFNSEERSYLAPWRQKSVPILTIFRADPTRGVYALPCPGVTYLAQVLVWR